MALSPLVEKMLAQMVQQQGPMLSPLAPVGQMALAAALAMREKRANQADEKEKAGIVDVLARLNAPPGETKNITLESISGPPTTIPVEDSQGMVNRQNARDLYSKMPTSVLAESLMKRLSPEKSDLVRGRPGDVFLTPDGQPAFTVPGAPADIKLPETKNVQFPDGTLGMAGQDPNTGRWVRTGADGGLDLNSPIPPGSIFVGMSVQSQTPEGLRPTTPKQENDLVAQETTMRNVISNIGRTRQLLGEGATFSFTGWLTRSADSVRAQAQQMASLFGAKTMVNGKEVPSSQFLASMGNVVNDALKDTPLGAEASKSAALRSNLVSLAYSVALSNNPDGRISEADFRNALNELSANSGSPDQLNAVLNEVQRRAQDNFANLYRVTRGEPLPPGYFDDAGTPVPTMDGASPDELPPDFNTLSPDEQQEFLRLLSLQRKVQ